MRGTDGREDFIGKQHLQVQHREGLLTSCAASIHSGKLVFFASDAEPPANCSSEIKPSLCEDAAPINLPRTSRTANIVVGRKMGTASSQQNNTPETHQFQHAGSQIWMSQYGRPRPALNTLKTQNNKVYNDYINRRTRTALFQNQISQHARSVDMAASEAHCCVRARRMMKCSRLTTGFASATHGRANQHKRAQSGSDYDV